MEITNEALDAMTTLELWELHERVAARLGPPGYREHYDGSYDEVCPAQECGYATYAAIERMKALI